MPIVKMHGKGQIIVPKHIRDKLGVTPGQEVSLELFEDHLEIRPLPDDPIDFLTGIFEAHSASLAEELLKERRADDAVDESDRL